MKVTRARMGSMPTTAEVALANGLLARRLRHAARCNCGTGIMGKGCTRTHPRAGDAALETITKTAEECRARMNAYRRNRTWEFSGATPR